MALYVAFGVNVGNLGRIGERRKEMVEWVQEINRQLTGIQSSTRIIDWYGHTGNFVVESSGADLPDVLSKLESVLGVHAQSFRMTTLTDSLQLQPKQRRLPLSKEYVGHVESRLL